jgi:hypothetical protein
MCVFRRAGVPKAHRGGAHISVENMSPLTDCQPGNNQDIMVPTVHASQTGPYRVSAILLQVSRTARGEVGNPSKVEQRHQLAGCHKERTSSCCVTAGCPAFPEKSTQELITHNSSFFIGTQETQTL